MRHHPRRSRRSVHRDTAPGLHNSLPHVVETGSTESDRAQPEPASRSNNDPPDRPQLGAPEPDGGVTGDVSQLRRGGRDQSPESASLALSAAELAAKKIKVDNSSMHRLAFTSDRKCSQCGATPTNGTHMCETCLHQSFVDARAEAGLPPRIENEDALDHIARLFPPRARGTPQPGLITPSLR